MTGGPPDVTEQLEQLRLAFDRTFALPERAVATARASFIAIRIDHSPFALRNADILAIFKATTLTGVPSPISSLLGLAQYRDALLPVHDLGPLVGVGPTAGTWMVVDRGGQAALAFSSFEGPIPIEQDADAPAGENGSARSEIITSAGEVRPIVDLPAVLAAIHQQCARVDAGQGEK